MLINIPLGQYKSFLGKKKFPKKLESIEQIKFV